MINSIDLKNFLKINLNYKNKFQFTIIYCLFFIIFCFQVLIFLNYSITLSASSLSFDNSLIETQNQQRREQEESFNERLKNNSNDFNSAIPKNNENNINLVVQNIETKKQQQREEQEKEFDERRKQFIEDYNNQGYQDLLSELKEPLIQEIYQKSLQKLSTTNSERNNSIQPPQFNDDDYKKIVLSYGGYGGFVDSNNIDYIRSKQKDNDKQNLKRTQIFSQTPRIANTQFRIEIMNDYHDDILIPLIKQDKENLKTFQEIILKLQSSTNNQKSLDIPSYQFKGIPMEEMEKFNTELALNDNNNFDIQKLDFPSLTKYIVDQSDSKFLQAIQEINQNINIDINKECSFLFSVEEETETKSSLLLKQVIEYLKLENNPIKNRETLIKNLTNRINDYYSKILVHNKKLEHLLTESSFLTTTNDVHEQQFPTLYSLYHRWHNKNYILKSESDLQTPNHINAEIKDIFQGLSERFIQQYTKILKSFEANKKYILLDLERQKKEIENTFTSNNNNGNNFFLQDKDVLIRLLEKDIKTINDDISEKNTSLEKQYNIIDAKIKDFIKFLSSVPKNSIQSLFNSTINDYYITKTSTFIKENSQFIETIRKENDEKSLIKSQIQQNICRLERLKTPHPFQQDQRTTSTIEHSKKLLNDSSKKLLDDINDMIKKINNSLNNKPQEAISILDTTLINNTFNDITQNSEHFLYQKINSLRHHDVLMLNVIDPLILKYKDIFETIEKIIQQNNDIIKRRQKDIISLSNIIKEESLILFDDEIKNREQVLQKFKDKYTKKYDSIQKNLLNDKQNFQKNKTTNDYYLVQVKNLNNLLESNNKIEQKIQSIQNLISKQLTQEQVLEKFFDQKKEDFNQIEQKLSSNELFKIHNSSLLSSPENIQNLKNLITNTKKDINAINQEIKSNIDNNTEQPLRSFIQNNDEYSLCQNWIIELLNFNHNVNDINILQNLDISKTEGHKKYLYV
ncbi:hypothetical protein ATP_00038 [Candidatus Phytoplasma mali]|uniref:Transmembrane protein n=1 Tax=Phytoplasma mali (strain AT) TaxID=482235 RepID=B3R061_PHYMT|nr:hypothetical protein [Candidatus Phytoplasma mali]CAP18225.1 hypothetical protein ATP_00038 [Candidatus Phytoplasma mali]